MRGEGGGRSTADDEVRMDDGSGIAVGRRGYGAQKGRDDEPGDLRDELDDRRLLFVGLRSVVDAVASVDAIRWGGWVWFENDSWSWSDGLTRLVGGFSSSDIVGTVDLLLPGHERGWYYLCGYDTRGLGCHQSGKEYHVTPRWFVGMPPKIEHD
jgi:hypothetical protein